MKYGTLNLVKRGDTDAHYRAKICELLIVTEMSSNHEFIRKLLPFILS